MGHRLSKIYTRTGDDGSTGLADNTRVPKDAARIAAMGAVDELNSQIGLLLVEMQPHPLPNPDGTTRHSTRPARDASPVDGYPPQAGPRYPAGAEGANAEPHKGTPTFYGLKPVKDRMPNPIDDARELLVRVQQRLFDLGGELSMPGYQALDEEETRQLEAAIDRWNATLPPLKEFILPGGCRAGALCHMARTVCRRAERGLVRLHHTDPVRPELLRYLNRLSDLLFVLARVLNREAGMEITYWQKPG